MSARNAMYHRCTVQRNRSHLSDHTDTWGGDSSPLWYDYLTNVSCKFWFKRAVTFTGSSGERQNNETTRFLILPITTVITAQDRILVVTDRRSKVVADGPMRIDSIGARVDHLQLQLVLIT
jgi:hypothetical protein